ncbi:MAG: sigma-54 dependent transcriptional regulator [Pseudomonadales bacterium]|nr:sigma-54 dependent transcriptional regulator [Pseudomonadales bacterium]
MPTTKHTLVIDDEPDIRELLEITLGRMGIETTAAANVLQAKSLLQQHTFDLCLTDMQLPDGNGLEVIQHIGKHFPNLPVAMITAFGSMDTAIDALKAGAFDYVQKPIDLEQLRRLVDTALKLRTQDGDVKLETGNLLGRSGAMNDLRARINKLSRSQAPIYIAGESGSGKEVAARMIHQQGPRAESDFVPVNCGAIPSELMESEFFGHVKGSFTGAVTDKKGLFQAASGGTLFLDEIADLPLSMQVKLLRAIQEKAVRPVGSQIEDRTDVRVLCATHKNLSAEVAAGRFRQDLYYRLNVIELRIPPLREHPEDIEQLASHCLRRLAESYSEPEPTISKDALTVLQQHLFPGNVRELENVLERAFTLCEGSFIQVLDLQLQGSPINVSDIRAAEAHSDPASAPTDGPTRSPKPDNSEQPKLPEGEGLEEYLDGIERSIITHALESTRWNKTAAAKELGITFRALRYKLEKLNLE